MLTERQAQILKSIVGEYVGSARPVGSQSIVRMGGLGLSSATIRNEMARLEEEGYIVRRHISGGGIPSDKGYRYYVESLTQGTENMPIEERLMIAHLFHQVERELEEWTRLAAVLLSRMVHNVAVVTFPKEAESRIKHLKLVSLQRSLAVLILLLHQAKLKQQLIEFSEGVTQDELDVVSNQFNCLFHDLTWPQIVAQRVELSPIQEQVRDSVIQLMAAEDEQLYEEPYIEGLSNIVAQPEFALHRDMLGVIGLLERRDVVRAMLHKVLVGDGIRVLIGAENREDGMKGCSLVVTKYGVPGRVRGAIGVIGPTRMPYGKAISTVSYMGSLMSNLAAEIYSG
jgi:heat-inducible transcriptional repressor